MLTAFLLAGSVLLGQAKKTEEVKETKKEIKAEKKALKKLEEKAGISTTAKLNFDLDFGKVSDVQWKKGMYFFEATFTQNAQKLTAYYDPEGILVGTTQAKKFADLPEKAQKEIQTRYKDYTPGPVLFYDDNETNDTDMLLYGEQFHDADNYFIEMVKGPSKIILMINPSGVVSFFKQL